MSPTITALYAGLLGILYLVLCWRVVVQRRRSKVGIGVGGDTALERAVRVHGNFAEYAPLFVVLLLVAELNGGTPVLLHVLGVLFVLARIGHALGLGSSSGISKGRFYGTLVTWTALLVLAVLNILLVLA